MKIIPTNISIRISDQGGHVVIVKISDLEGREYTVFLESSLADDLGREILAGVLALEGKLK
jgi:hypothetical protein